MSEDNVNIDENDISDDMKEEFNKSGKIHIEKTGNDGEDVKVDVDKNKKTVDVNVDKDGKKTNVKIGFSGIKVDKDGQNKVNIQFWPIFVFLGLFIGGIFFAIYKIVEFIVKG